ncbi:hypothetical protein HHI36_018822 [Cryptolaemus montrouzieri]|uniref:NTF2 domain-containing protein n=1 Tax=Cryptolaemus montrouzieri TaxID=559131 RepID=A0ABD2P136_9CUCU
MDDQTYAVKERSSDSIVINHGNVSTDLLKYIPILTNSEYWHAFHIQNVNNITRNEILKIVLDYVYPLDLIPVRFEREGNHCMFLARNCAEAILKLCKDNLTIPHPNKTGKLYQCEIVLKHATLSTLQSEENIYEVVQSLFEEPNKTLNLQKFSDNVGLVEYSPLSQPKILSYVLYLSKKLEPTCIKLNSNEIRSLYPFEAVSGLHSVKQLDLRNNLIDDISELKHIYIDKIREILPLVVVLDGVPIGKRGGSTLKIKNYLCKNEGFDLVDQFIAHFFPIYDYKRILLQSLYHPKAMFSLTCLYKEGLINSGTTKLDSYEPINRNLLSHSFLSKPQENIIIGRGEILKKIDTLPKTEHDGHSFCVDLIHYTGSLAVISINGIFREVPKAAHESNRLMGFHRIFVLGRTKSEYYICNDLLHVYNALNHQVSSAFTVGDTVKIGVLPAASTPKEKEKVQEAMILTTGIDREWARRLLEDIDYDLIKCLKKFMDLLKKTRSHKKHLTSKYYIQNVIVGKYEIIEKYRWMT